MNRKCQNHLINSGTIDLYHSPVEVDEACFEICLSVLSADERARAEAYRFEKDRSQFIVARGLLRTLLAGYLDLQAAEIEFGFEEFGKPFLRGQDGNSIERIYFNLAHSGSHILLGFSRSGEIGVDIEEQRVRRKPLLELAGSICTSEELHHINGLDSAAAEIALTRLWTAKEAFLKALGTGLQIEPNQIEIEESVLLGSPHPTHVRRLDKPDSENTHVLYPLPDCESLMNCSAALAACGEVRVNWRELT